MAYWPIMAYRSSKLLEVKSPASELTRSSRRSRSTVPSSWPRPTSHQNGPFHTIFDRKTALKSWQNASIPSQRLDSQPFHTALLLELDSRKLSSLHDISLRISSHNSLSGGRNRQGRRVGREAEANEEETCCRTAPGRLAGKAVLGSQPTQRM